MNIIFDLGGVILLGKAKDILNKLNVTEEEYTELNDFFKDWNDMDKTDASIEDKFNSYNFSDSIKSKYKDKLIKYYELRDLNTKLINLIKELKNNNNKVYILSDNNKDASNYYKTIDGLNNLDGYVFSYEYGTIKKEGKLFDILLEKYNLDPSTCYFIDDTKENIEVANSKGMNGILYENNEEEIINYFKDRGII